MYAAIRKVVRFVVGKYAEECRRFLPTMYRIPESAKLVDGGLSAVFAG